MTAPLAMDGPTFGPSGGAEAIPLVILLHGVGSNGDDLISLAPLLAQALPDAEFLSPNAPYRCEMSPMGFQWFDILTQDAEKRLAQLRVTAEIVNTYIDDQLARRGLTDKDLVLGGFSQGTMISLFVAPRREVACAGVLGYSGRLESPHLLAGEIKSRPPVLLIHGELDDRLPAPLMDEAAATLRENRVPVETHCCPGLGHSIDPDGVMLGAGFLIRAFS